MRFATRALLLVVVMALDAGAANAAAARLNGLGATSLARLYQLWIAELARSGGPRVTYRAAGSGAGRWAFINQAVNFAATDNPLQPKDLARVRRGVVQIPMVGGSVALAYNKPDCDLKLTQTQAVQVAIGLINNWTQLGCPPGQLTWVHRSDRSGTTKVLTQSLEAFSPLWTLGTGMTIKWPGTNAIAAKGNSGVASVIQATRGAIGYVNQSYLKSNLQAAALENQRGEFIRPTAVSAARALDGINLDSNLAGEMSNPSTQGAYPISTLIWMLAYRSGNGSNTSSIRDTFNFMLSSDAQKLAVDLGFVPLNDEILSKARAAVNKIGK